MIDAAVWIVRAAFVIASCVAIALLTVGIADMWKDDQ